VVSVSFRWPVWNDETKSWDEGEIKDYAWPFDQGPVLGKPGAPFALSEEHKVHDFTELDQAEQDRILRVMGRALGREFTADDVWNLGPDQYVALVGWLDRRDFLILQNAKHDEHQFRVGLRKDAGGFKGAEGFAKWDLDSEPGQWVLGEEQVVEVCEPSDKPLKKWMRRRKIHDTMLVQKQLMDQLEVSSLKPTSVRLFGEDSDEDEVRLKSELSKMGARMTKRYDLLMWQGAMGVYAALDTRRTLMVFEYERERIQMGAVLGDYQTLENKEHQLLTTLYRMEKRGVPYDVEGSKAEGQRMREWNKKATGQFPFDVTKPNAAKRFYFGPTCSQADKAVDIAKADVLRAQAQASLARRLADAAEAACVPGKTGRILKKHTNAAVSARMKANKAQADVAVLEVYVERLKALEALGAPGICPSSCEECGGKNGLGFDPLSRTDTGLPQLDELGIQHLEHESAPLATEYRAYKKRQKAGNDWYTNWAAKTGSDGFIRTDYRQTVQQADKPGRGSDGGVKSGRLSCTRWGALQIPKKDLIPEGAVPVRQFIGNEEDYELYEHDLATGEFRVAVVLAGIPRLWDALDAGLDVHAMNAKALFGVTEDNPRFKTYRQAGKGATFCILYGGGPKALKDQLEKALGEPISMARAAEAIKNFYRTYPEFKRMTDQAVRKVDRDRGGLGFLTMLDGWQRWYSVNEKTNSAFNQVIQGNLARACIDWMLEVERRVPGVLLLQIHDSLITRHRKGPEGEAEAQLVSDIGNEVFERYFRLSARGNRTMSFGIEPDKWSPYK
jgi:DNA polymerase I-like protein with 3'-5' exonuclease and polymerase domains